MQFRKKGKEVDEESKRQLDLETSAHGVIVDGLSVEEAHFRGRKLQGTTVAIPHGYSVAKQVVISKLLHRQQQFLLNMENEYIDEIHVGAAIEMLHQPVSVEDLEAASIDQELEL
ncbi:uncharacterized protein LOC132047664 [Lycium ferocissimum]|uniref:uncharacterized protein LOC132047664 n=1 Tax=Lycium ferocissimum TaxID=112874 RepID=UPI002815853F|nr:uncharacterized protein LOC132047664 [Lycium ferocissimum]